MKKLIGLAIIVAGFWIVLGGDWEHLRYLSAGFSDEDIANTKAAIKLQFEKRDGIKVSEVFLMRETPRKLIGFAKLKLTIKGVQLGNEIISRGSATWGEDGKYLWECGAAGGIPGWGSSVASPPPENDSQEPKGHETGNGT